MIKKILLLMVISFNISFASGYTGGSGSVLLMMDSFGARQMALSDVFVGIANDINTITVNPAGINTLKNREISIMYMPYFLGMNLEYVSGGMPLSGEYGVVGANIGMFQSGQFDFFDELGNKEEKKLSANEWVATFSYANNFLKHISPLKNFHTGINIKILHTSLVDNAKTTYAVDIGMLYKIRFLNMFYKNKETPNFGIGVSVQNIGGAIQYQEAKTDLPQNIRLGIGYQIYAGMVHSYLIGVDVNLPNDSNAILGVGLEYGFKQMFYGRVGYKMYMNQTSRLTGGVGIQYPVVGKELRLDYGIKLFEELGPVHTISLGLQF